MTYVIRELALQDLEEIWLYTLHEWDAKQADSYISQMFERFQWLVENHQLGRNLRTTGSIAIASFY